MELSEIIIDKIRNNGPISFHAFMEMALYYPSLGYYTSPRDKIGTEGDYYTSSNLTSLFGVVIGRQIEEMWKISGKESFNIIEYGAGTGKLCHDILDYLKKSPEFYSKLQYCIIEKSPQLRQKEKTQLHEKVNWYDCISEIPKSTSCILSNELVDNFAVHQVVMEEELMEIFVDYQEGFIELLRPAAKELRTYLDELGVLLPKGFRTEINLQAIQWIEEIASFLEKGYIMTIDYGYPTSGLYTKEKSCGTIVCYHQHTINEGPYHDIGNQDITSHVNFSALCHWGLKNGLKCCGLTNYADFLLGLGFKELLRKSVSLDPDPVRAIRNEILLNHTLLMDMGTKFKVLIQSKGIAAGPLLGLSSL
jgi:SAM-dependent MidA family methyltransferase